MLKVATVAEYLESLPDNVRAQFGRLRAIVRANAPEAEERLSYQMPTFFDHGVVVHIGAFKNHVSLFAAGSRLMDELKEELRGYKTSKGTIQFKLDEPLPEVLIAKIVQRRVAENRARNRGKSSKSP